jgi:hypothetical protein
VAAPHLGVACCGREPNRSVLACLIEIVYGGTLLHAESADALCIIKAAVVYPQHAIARFSSNHVAKTPRIHALILVEQK